MKLWAVDWETRGGCLWHIEGSCAKIFVTVFLGRGFYV